MTSFWNNHMLISKLLFSLLYCHAWKVFWGNFFKYIIERLGDVLNRYHGREIIWFSNISFLDRTFTLITDSCWRLFIWPINRKTLIYLSPVVTQETLQRSFDNWFLIQFTGCKENALICRIELSYKLWRKYPFSHDSWNLLANFTTLMRETYLEVYF